MKEKKRLAILKHQKGNIYANLLWGLPLPPSLDIYVAKSCQALKEFGYFASAFPEKDGVTISHPNYSRETALADVQKAFYWLDITDKLASISQLYENEVVQCTILVPVEKLHLTCLLEVEPYRFIPALGFDESGNLHPWYTYFSENSIDSIYNAREAAQRRGSLGIDCDDALLTYPLVETEISIPYRELLVANEYPDGMSPLLLRCAEYADRGLDLLRIEQCNYKQLERLCSRAGQLLNGFHAAYVIPKDGAIPPTLYCHLASPYQVAPNWLGLDVDTVGYFSFILAPIVHSITGDEISLRVRGAVRAYGQAFYILSAESRFLSLIFTLDGLCAPKKNWSGLTHHSYIAAVAANGDVTQFNQWLRFFDKAYSNIRNKLVHEGASFIEIGEDADQISNKLMLLLRACISTVSHHSFSKISDLQASIISEMKSSLFQEVIKTYTMEKQALSPSIKHLTMPNWK
jgi:hypothetical protein